ncbi:MAG: hypothetical protein ABSB39_16635 [Candidatus Sulfotelmatobacter sp.]
MKLQLFAPLLLLFAAPPLPAQSTATLVYAESFRQGSTRIVEQSFEAKLTPQNSIYRERIKDSHGNDRYIFSLLPLGPEEDNEITSWQAKLADLHHPIYDNILLTSPQPSDDPKNVAKDALWRLEPGNYAPVPARARRIIKVDTFYVVLQVKTFHFTPPDSPYLDSMTVDVAFSNTDPRPPDSRPN